MKELFCTYEQSLTLKELGFDEKCFAIIDQTQFLHIKGTKRHPRGSMVYDEIDCPTKKQVFDWVSKKFIYPSVIRVRSWSTIFRILEWNPSCDSTNIIESISYTTYEEAETECINKLIELCKKK